MSSKRIIRGMMADYCKSRQHAFSAATAIYAASNMDSEANHTPRADSSNMPIQALGLEIGPETGPL